MEDSELLRCDSLDSGSGCVKDVTTLIDHMTLDRVGPDLEPSSAELAQCEAEVGTLLKIIAELNKKMGSLKAPSEPGDLKPPGPPRPLVPDLLSHRLVRSSPERNTYFSSRPPLCGRGGSSVMWSKLQEVLSSVEDSISCRRTWAAPITAYDQDKQREHLKAAQESRVKATQILEEMEREFGISCPSDLPDDQYQADALDVDKRDCELRITLQSHQEELERAQSRINQVEDEKLLGLHKSRRSGSYSSSYRPSGGSSAGALSPDWASPPFPGSPLLLRRTARAVTPLSTGGEPSSLASTRSGSPCGSPISLETETERLHRYVERLKARNERLTAALERRKGESELITITLNKLEADCSALQMALRYCEECEEAYSELLSLYETKKLQSIPLQTDSAEPVSSSPAAQHRKMGSEELSTSFSTAGVTEETETQSHTGQRTSEVAEREAALRQQIERLKRSRAAICLPKPGPRIESKPGPDAATPAGTRGVQHVSKDNAKPPDTKKEKSSLFYELISVREEMSDLRALIRLKEKELRCLEWGLMAEKAHDAAGAFISDNLREELEERKSEQQRLSENAAKLAGDEDVPGPLTRPILRELQAVMQREQALKRRLALVHDSMNAALSDRRDSGEQIARLTQAHSKALSSYRHMRRKYREQVWRLEQRVVAMSESHQNQTDAPKAPAEASEWRREETVL